MNHDSTEHHAQPAPRRGLPVDPQRFLIPVELDRTRVLCFDHRAAFLLYQRYGDNWWRELYEPDPNDTNPEREQQRLRLRSPEAFEFFLLVGLQRDGEAAGDEITIEQLREYIVPTNISALANGLLIALAATRKPKNAHANGAAAAPLVN